MNQRDDQTNELLSAYLDGELSPEEHEQVVRLLGTYAEPRRVLQEMQTLGDRMRQLPPYRLGAEFCDEVLAAAPSDTQPAIGQSTGAPSAVEAAAGVRRPTLARLPIPSNDRGTWIAVAASLAIAASLLLVIVLNDPHSGLVATVPPTSAGQPPITDRTATDDAGVFHPVTQPRSANDAQAGHPIDEPPSLGPKHVVAEQSEAQHDSVQPGHSAPVSPDRKLAGSPGQAAPQSARNPGAGKLGARNPGAAGTGSAQVAAAPPATRLLLVMDVTVSRKGQDEAAFERQLIAAGAAFDGSIRTNHAMEDALLKSRFLVPLPQVPAKRPVHGLQLVYVVAQAGQVDTIWKTMKARGDWFSNVDMDMAIKPTDMTVFKQLRAAVRLQGLSPATPMVNLQEQTAIAHRLALPPGWKGAAPTRLGKSAFPAMPPATLPFPGQPGATPRPAHAPTARGATRDPSRPLGHEMIAEILFVVHPQTP